jgi:hypothetical protein
MKEPNCDHRYFPQIPQHIFELLERYAETYSLRNTPIGRGDEIIARTELLKSIDDEIAKEVEDDYQEGYDDGYDKGYKEARDEFEKDED